MAEITRNGVERMLKRLERFGKEAMDELLDDILAILTSEDVERAALTPRERADIIALIKGRYAAGVLQRIAGGGTHLRRPAEGTSRAGGPEAC